ncbi:MAG: hypothetical protein H0V89_03290 [Deltaproteobacteria bacterium]|nr:hypothetical protein [Deltaproteobacteria bacterium]
MRPFVLVVLVACGPADDGGAPDAPAGPLSGCDPVDPSLCALPYPSSYFQVPADTVSGVQNAFPAESLPINRDSVRLAPDLLNRYDGFSTITPAVTYLEAVSLDGAIAWTEPDAYLAPDARTVWIDAETGERLPHFVELDATADSDADRALILHPLVPMAHGRRYVVGIRDLVRKDGGPVVPSPAFAALRDGTPSDLPDVALRQAHYDDAIFPVLEADGLDRASLQLAWDFTTSSVESSLGRALAVRDDALDRIGPTGPSSYTIDSSEDGDCANPGANPIARTIYGHYTAPRYTLADNPGLDARLVDGADGLPTWQGETEVDFMVRVPCSLAADPGGGGMILQYGHGLLGDLGEARADYLAQLADTNRWVILAQNWTGMSGADVGPITLMLATDLSDFEIIPDRTIQGFTELMSGLRLAANALAADPLLQYGGLPVIDGTRAGYYGNSQGGIFGAAYLALSPDLARGVLGVPGAPYSLLLSRSADFDTFFHLFDEKFTDDRDRALLLALLQTAWDPGEPGGYLRHLTADPLPGTPAKQVLLQAALGDAQVTTFGAELMARAFGASTVAPETQPIWGVTEQQPPFTGSAIVEFAYTDVAPMPVENLPPATESDPHECPRREPGGQAQIGAFLETGEIVAACEGRCESLRAVVCP